MTQTKIGFFTDAHIAGQAPNSRQDDYTNSVLKKLAFCLKRCSGECDLVVFGGDLTHSHKLGNDRLKERVIDVFIENLSVPFLYTYGQHDLRGEDLNSRDESTTAFIMRMLKRLGKDVVEIPHDSWILYGDTNIALRACPRGIKDPVHFFQHACIDKKFPENASARIVVAHHLISDNTSPWLVDHKKLMTGFKNNRVVDVVLSGDLHNGFGPCLNQLGTLFVNPGSLARTVVHDGKNGVVCESQFWSVDTQPGSEVFRESAPLLDEETYEDAPMETETKSFDEVVARLADVKKKRIDVWDLLEKRARDISLEPDVLSFLLSKRPNS
jgi:hypothetical protein